ncbi:MAG: metallophosphoesterase [Firmicutes bacterium]|nr:metallophosphoesterase [Bacillota bacterium]
MKKKRITAVLLAAAVLAGFCIWQNNDLTVSRSQVVSGRIPAEFDGYTIVQVSDLHNKEFGRGQRRIVSKIVEQNPDIIVITGDMIDSRNTDVETALDFAQKAVGVAPCYYVPGNHENRIPEAYEQLKAGLKECGVTILENEAADLEQNGTAITLMGVLDPIFNVGKTDEAGNILEDERTVMEVQLENLDSLNRFTILLSHRPEMLDVYAEAGLDLVFTGHAHGGQWRLPGLGGIIAPGQGFFPEYTEGSHTEGDTTMYVSRGLGNSLMPIRIFNRPELVVVELCHEIG